MRRWSVLVAALFACSETRAVDPGPEAVDADVIVDAATASLCPGDASPFCYTNAEPCLDGGATYHCYGAPCPMGDAGTCEMLERDPYSQYTKSCCARVSCTIQSDTEGLQCSDGGAERSWACPSRNGRALVTPPGSSRCRLLTPAIPGLDGLTYCCPR